MHTIHIICESSLPHCCRHHFLLCYDATPSLVAVAHCSCVLGCCLAFPCQKVQHIKKHQIHSHWFCAGQSVTTSGTSADYPFYIPYTNTPTDWLHRDTLSTICMCWTRHHCQLLGIYFSHQCSTSSWSHNVGAHHEDSDKGNIHYHVPYH